MTEASRWDLQGRHGCRGNLLLVPLGSAPLIGSFSCCCPTESSFSFPTSRVGVLMACAPFPCPVAPAPGVQLRLASLSAPFSSLTPGQLFTI